MESSSLMNDGFTLMIFGMGFVFVFLTLLVIATSLMSWIITLIEKNVGTIPEEGVPSPSTYIPHSESHSEHQAHTDNKTLISIITAAVVKYRSRNKD